MEYLGTHQSLNALVFRHQLFHQIISGPSGVMGTFTISTPKYSVTTRNAGHIRNRAEEFYFIQFAPGSAAHNAVSEGAGYSIKT